MIMVIKNCMLAIIKASYQSQIVKKISNNKLHPNEKRTLDIATELFAKPKAVGKVPKIHFREPRVGTFTEFIQQAIQIINTYDDTTFGDFIDILDEEVENYHYRGCKFSELTKNHETRRVLQAKLNLISGLPVPQTRTNINAFADILRHERYNKKVKDFVDFINSLYGPETLDKFEKILNKLEYYSKPKVRRLESNLAHVVKDGLRTLIFDYYTNLHVNAKIALKEKIQTILNQIQATSSSAFNINRISYVPSSTNNFNVSANVITFPVHEFMPAHVTSEPRAEDRESSNDLKEASSMKARAKKREKEGRLKAERSRFTYGIRRCFRLVFEFHRVFPGETTTSTTSSNLKRFNSPITRPATDYTYIELDPFDHPRDGNGLG
ncbi:hypothetical protein HF086_006480 [Spodoptera exigua]|uniref:Uncharacterized protein n=1 Tax=Spodoptera exigua TaxID=7107 RepID=A0A922SB11_SPOEX|nr:hypothetical protein HF086_006480 [Spodoptera exigua]